jgi:hypothetical protein
MGLLPLVSNAIGYIARIRVVILVALLAFAIFAVPEQTLELYVINAQAMIAAEAISAKGQPLFFSPDFSQVLQFMLGILCIGLLSTVMWISTLRLLLVSQEPAPEPPVVPKLTHELTALLVAVLPVLAVVVGFRNAVEQSRIYYRQVLALVGPTAAGPLPLVAEQYWLNAASLFLVALISINMLVYYGLLRRRASAIVGVLFSLGGFVVICLFVLAFMVLIVFQPVALPVLLGTLAIVALFLATLSYVLTACASVTFRYKVPVISTLVILALVFAALDFNDNHRVNHDIENVEPPALEASFIEWFKQRKDREHFEKMGAPYPIYLVAAEGGGLYAAYHVATFMARMQDECPGFAQHTFALSAVSGGSLGAAVFTALANNKAKNEAWRQCSAVKPNDEFTRIVQRYFAHDFLSPLVASTLFPDFLQRFLPVPFYSLDRAKALEATFEQAWDSAMRAETGVVPGANSNPFKGPLSGVWGYDKAAPGLFLNTTTVTTGARVTLSHIHFEATPTAFHISDSLDYPCAGEHRRTVQISLSTAVSLSARFPWVAPVGWLEQSERRREEKAKCTRRGDFGHRLYLADGAYFENSGLESAIELAARLRRVIELHPNVFPNGSKSAEVSIIQVMAIDNFAIRWWSLDADLARSSPDELVAPLWTLLNTRKARMQAVNSRTAFDRSYYQDGRYYENTGNKVTVDHPTLGPVAVTRGYYPVMLLGTKLFLPLGWHLSAQTRRNIESQPSELTEAMRCLIRDDLDGQTLSDWDKRVASCLPAKPTIGGR